MDAADKLMKIVDDYMEEKGYKLKHSQFSSQNLTYSVETQCFNQIDAKYIKCKNGSLRLIFKLNGKVTSLKKDETK